MVPHRPTPSGPYVHVPHSYHGTKTPVTSDLGYKDRRVGDRVVVLLYVCVCSFGSPSGSQMTTTELYRPQKRPVPGSEVTGPSRKRGIGIGPTLDERFPSEDRTTWE